MQTDFQPISRRDDNAGGGPSQLKEPAGISGGILFFALLFQSVQAFSTSLPAEPIVMLAWSQSTNPAVAGYNIYYGGASGDYTNTINAGNATNATVSKLAPGLTYYFAATAYDDLGNERVFSSEISYTVPEALLPLLVPAAPAAMFTLMVTGPIGQTNEILATQDFSVWTVIGSVTVGAGSSGFTDTNAVNFPWRSYRTRQIP